MATNTASKMQPWEIRERRREILMRGAITMFALLLISLYLMPLGYGIVTSLKSAQQASDSAAPILPSEILEYDYEGKTYDVYQVPTEDGVQAWALVKKGRESSKFVDPKNPEAGLIDWEGRWRTLEPARELAFKWDNYPEAWNTINYVRLLGNTFKYAFVSMIGAVVSSAFVAYGFARFRFPAKNVLFMLVMATIVLPSAVTLVPTYAFFIRIGWGGTWLPLIVPQFFANAYNVFLMRQYFLTIPREMEEAASIDGANALRAFLDVILPQAVPALVAVCLFHFFFAWNDFFGPLIYLAGNSEQFPISVGLTLFNGLYASEPQLILAASLIAMVPPLTIFFLAQRVFIQGIVVSGVEK